MKYLLLTVLCAFLVACSDSSSPEDTNVTDNSTQLMPNSIGNYWIYERYEEGKIVGTDSLVLTAHTRYKSKSAYMCELYSFDDEYEIVYKDTVFFAEEEDKLFVNEKMPNNPWYDNTWVQIYGDKTDSWLAARFKAENENIYVTTTDVFPVTYDNVLTAKYVYSDQLIFGGSSQNFDQFEIKNDFLGHYYVYLNDGGVPDSVRVSGTRQFKQEFKIARGTGLLEKRAGGYYLVWSPEQNPYGLKQTTSHQPAMGWKLIRYEVE